MPFGVLLVKLMSVLTILVHALNTADMVVYLCCFASCDMRTLRDHDQPCLLQLRICSLASFGAGGTTETVNDDFSTTSIPSGDTACRRHHCSCWLFLLPVHCSLQALAAMRHGRLFLLMYSDSLLQPSTRIFYSVFDASTSGHHKCSALSLRTLS